MELKITRIRRIQVEGVKISRGTSNISPANEALVKSDVRKTLDGYNRLVGYSRIPNKDYHFHEKTYESMFLPKVFFKSASRLGMRKGSAPRTPSCSGRETKDRKMVRSYLLPAYYPGVK